MPRALALRLELAWIERKRSAPREFAMAVRSSRGMKTSVERVRMHVGAEVLAHEALEAERDVEDELLLLQAAAPDGPGVVTAVPGVDDDAPDAEAELAGEAVRSGAVRGRGLGGRRRRGGRGGGRRRPGPGGRRGRRAGAGEAVDAGDRDGSAAGRAVESPVVSLGTMPFTRRVGMEGGACATWGEGRACPRTSMTRRVGLSRKKTWCSQTSLKSRTTRTTSSWFWAIRTCSRSPSPTGNTRRARFGCRRVPRRSTQSRSGFTARSDCSVDLPLDVDHDAGRGVPAPGPQVEHPGEARGRRGGERDRGLALAEELLDLRHPLALGVGVEIGPGGLGQPPAVGGLAGDLDHGPQRVVAEAARGVLRHEHPVGGGRVLAVPGRAEAPCHLAVEVPGGEQRVVAVAAAGVAGHDLAVAQDDGLPLGPLLAAAPRGAQAGLGGLRLLVERGVGPRRSRGRAAGGGRLRGAAAGAGERHTTAARASRAVRRAGRLTWASCPPSRSSPWRPGSRGASSRRRAR